MQKPRLTICLPIYNAEKYLKIALDSIISQDFKDFQVFIFDNCSEDSTPEICKEYTEKDNRFNYIKNEVNVGAIKNFNNAVAYADTEFFVWLAHDDSWEPTFLSKCIEKLDNNKDSVLCCTGTNYIDINGNIIPEMQALDRGEGIETLGLDYQQRISALWSKSCWEVIYGVYRTDFIKNTNLLSYSYGPDVCFLTGLLVTDNIICVKERLFNYRFVIKSMDQYQSCFFSNNKYVEKPMTENYSSLFQYIFNLKISNTLKLEVSDYLLKIILAGNDKFKIFSENKDVQESEILKAILLTPALEENLKKEFLSLNSNSDKRETIENNILNDEISQIKLFLKEGNYKTALLMLKGIESEYKLTKELVFIKSLLEFKLNRFKESLLLLETLLVNEESNNNSQISENFYEHILLNNKALTLLKNYNYIDSFKIFKDLSLESSNKQILDNCIKIFSYLEDYDSIQEIKNIDIDKKASLSKDLIKSIISKNNYSIKNKPLVSVILINNEKNNLLFDQLRDIALQSIHNYIEIFIVSEINKPLSKKVEATEIFYDKSKNENIIHAINKSIKKSNGIYITLVHENERYINNYFEEITNFFNSNDSMLAICYSNIYSTQEHTLDKVNSFSEWNRDMALSSVYLKFKIPFIWKSSIHNLYGYLDENIEDVSLLEFVLRVSQTHNVLNSKIYSGYLELEPNNSDTFTKEYLSVSQKYIDSANKKILHLEKELPIFDIIESLDIEKTKVNNTYPPFYVVTNQSKSIKNNNKYLILNQTIHTENISINDIMSINRIYDQIWVTNEEIKEEYIDAGINKNKIEVIPINEYDEDKLTILIKENILKLTNKEICRLNIEEKKSNLIEKGFEYFKNKEYSLAEEKFYELAINHRNPDYFYNLGVCQYYQSKYDDAIDSLSTSLELGLISSDLFNFIALSLEKTGDNETAKRFYLKAKELSSNNR